MVLDRQVSRGWGGCAGCSGIRWDDSADSVELDSACLSLNPSVQDVVLPFCNTSSIFLPQLSQVETDQMTPASPSFFSLMVVLIVSLSADSLGDHAVFTGTTAARLKMDAALKQQLEAKKQVALKQASVDVEKKREAALQLQLREIQKRLQAEAEFLAAAVAEQAASAKDVEALSTAFKQHQHVDSLVAAAAVAATQASTARTKHKALVDQFAAMQQAASEQQEIESKATSAIQVVAKQIAQTTAQLTTARTTFDASAKELEVARLDVTTAEAVAKDRLAAVKVQRSRASKAAAALTQLSASVKSLQESLAAIQDAAKTAGMDSPEAVSELAKSITGVMPLKQRASDLLAAANVRVAAAEKLLTESDAALSAAQDQARVQQDQYAKFSRTHFRLQLALADLQSGEKTQSKQLAAAKAQQKQLAVSQAELKSQVAAAAVAVQKSAAEYATKQSQSEAAMEPLGRFVSFSKHIAPIFAKRCVACHNTKTTSGGLNLESFAALVRGGESGVVFKRHDADSSLLLSKIEDGSMPKDADALTKSEVALIQHWIQVGTPLGAGIEETSLITAPGDLEPAAVEAAKK